MADKGKRMIFEDEYQYLKDLRTNHSDPSAEWGGSGSTYTSGDGISISEDVISIDNTVALKTDIVTSYNDLTDKPTIPTKTSELNNDSGFITKSVNDLTNYTPTSSLATVATSGSYNDLINKPVAPIVILELAQPTDTGGTLTQTQYDTLLNNPEAILVVKGYISSSAEMYLRQVLNTTYTSDLVYQTQILNTSGSYGYQIVTIQSNLTWTLSNDSFTIPTIPTNISAFTNDAGYITGITSSDVTTALGYTPGTSNFSGSYTDLTDKPSIPSSASSTSTITPTTSTFVTGTSTTTETLTFTYSDNTTANITIVTSVTDSTSNAMTGATVSTTTTLS